MATQVFTCPNCGGTIPVSAGSALSATCPFCNSLVDVPEDIRDQLARMPAPPPPPEPEIILPSEASPVPLPPPAPPVAEKRGPRKVPMVIVALVVAGIGLCICLCAISNISPRADLTVNNQSDATICSVTLKPTNLNMKPFNYLGSHQIASGSSYTITGVSKTAYDIVAYDCSGGTLADDKNIDLKGGNFIWTVSAPK